jgi:hypothetical protein
MVEVVFNGVGLVGVFCRPRGVAAAVFEGVRVILASFVGVAGPEADRDGVPGVDKLPERLGPAMLVERDRSRNAYSFL